MILLGSSHDSRENETLFVKIEAVVFWTYCWICLLGPSSSDVVSRPKAPRSRHFIRFHDFIGLSHYPGQNEVLLVKIGARVLDLWQDTTSSGPKWPKSSF